jgi:hypothetical protein
MEYNFKKNIKLTTNNNRMTVDLLLGLQWEMKEKVKLLSVLTLKIRYYCSFQGRTNAGNT